MTQTSYAVLFVEYCRDRITSCGVCHGFAQYRTETKKDNGNIKFTIFCKKCNRKESVTVSEETLASSMLGTDQTLRLFFDKAIKGWNKV